MTVTPDALRVAIKIRDMGTDISSHLNQTVATTPVTIRNDDDLVLFLRLVTVLLEMSTAVQQIIDEHTE